MSARLRPWYAAVLFALSSTVVAAQNQRSLVLPRIARPTPAKASHQRLDSQLRRMLQQMTNVPVLTAVKTMPFSKGESVAVRIRFALARQKPSALLFRR